MGSEFTVRLPVPVESPASAEVPRSEVSATRRRRRILVVDDNRDAAASLATLLGLEGHEIHIAYDGAEAVRAAAALRPDIILLDIGLPKINGYDAARMIRAEAWGKTMKLVALTGWGQPDDYARGKPASIAILAVTLEVLNGLLAELSQQRRLVMTSRCAHPGAGRAHADGTDADIKVRVNLQRMRLPERRRSSPDRFDS
jgi:CheY-like chemotaxis protein